MRGEWYARGVRLKNAIDKQTSRLIRESRCFADCNVDTYYPELEHGFASMCLDAGEPDWQANVACNEV